MTLGFNPEIETLTTKRATDNPIAQDGWSQDEGPNPALHELVQSSISSVSQPLKASSLKQRQINLDDSTQHECVQQMQPGLTLSPDVQNLENQIDELDQLINDCDQMINTAYQQFKNAPVCDKPGKIDEIQKLLDLKGRLLEKKADLLDRIAPLAYRSNEQVLNIRQAMNDSLELNKYISSKFSQLKDISIESYRQELISEKKGMISLINERIRKCDQLEEKNSQQVQVRGLSAIAEIKDALSLKLNLFREKAKLQQEILFLSDPVLQQTLQSEFQTTLDQCNSTISVLKNYKEFETSLAERLEIPEALEIEILEKELEIQIKLQTINRFYGIVLDSRTDLHPNSKWLPGGWSDCENLIMKREIEEFIEENRHHLTQEEIKHLEACSKSLENATQLEYEQRVNPQETAEKIRKQIEQLKDGGALLLSGGTKRHAIVYEVRRKNEDYIFTIVNTGDDEIGKEQRNGQLDPVLREHGQHKQLRYAHKAYLCSLSALDIEFIEKILPNHSDKLIAADHYLNISQMMSQRNASPIYGRLHHPQGGQSCTLKSISSWLKGDLMNQFGEERGKVLHAQFQVFRAEKRIEEMIEFQKENPELVWQTYSATSTEDLQHKIEIRDLAVQQVLEKRRRKGSQR